VKHCTLIAQVLREHLSAGGSEMANLRMELEGVALLS